MHKKTAGQAEALDVPHELLDLGRRNGTLVPLALDAIPSAISVDLAVQSPIAGVAPVTLHYPTLAGKAIQYQFLKGQRIDLAQVGDPSSKGFLCIGSPDLQES